MAAVTALVLACGSPDPGSGASVWADRPSSGAAGHYGDGDAVVTDITAWDALSGPSSGKFLEDDGASLRIPPALALPCGGSTPKTDGTCCPAGQGYDPKAQGCLVPALAECPDLNTCRPRWCADGQDAAGAACPAGAAGCWLVPRACTAVELAGVGCKAGQLPTDQGCAAVGGQVFLPGGQSWAGVQPLPLVPSPTDALPEDLKLGPLKTLEPPSPPTWCPSSAADGISPCPGMAGCPVGQLQTPAGSCVALDQQLPALCPPGFEASVGLPAGCTPSTSECGTDAFGGVAEDGKNIFVDKAFAGIGQGTRSQPFATLAEALQAVSAGATVALAAGTYTLGPKATSISGAVQVQGRCANLVMLQGSSVGAGAWIEVWGKLKGVTVQDGPVALLTHGGSVVSGVRIQGASYAAIRSMGGTLQNILVLPGKRGVLLDQPGTTTMIEGLRVIGASERGLGVSAGAVAQLSDIVVTGTVAGSGGVGGIGVQISQMAQVTLDGLRVEGSLSAGVLVADLGTEATVTRALISGTMAQPSDGTGGHGVTVTGGAHLRLQQAALVGNVGIGALAWGPGSTLLAANLRVRDTLAAPDGSLGEAVRVQNGATGQVTGLWTLNNRSTSAICLGPSSHLRLAGATIEATQPNADGDLGHGLRVQGGCSAEVWAVRIDGSRHRGLSVADAGSVLFGGAATVTNTQAQASDQKNGYGAEVTSGATLKLNLLRMSGSHGIGLWVTGAGSAATLDSLTVIDTQPEAEVGSGGHGIQVKGGAWLAVGGPVRVEDSHDFGLLVDGLGTEVSLGSSGLGVQIASTHPRTQDGLGGRGVQVQAGGHLDLTHASVSQATEAGIVATGKQTVLNLKDAYVTYTAPRATAGDLGHGLVVEAGAKAVADHLVVAGNRDAGIMVHGAGLQASDVSVSGTMSTLSLASAGPATGGLRGRGLVLQGAGEANLQRVRLSANAEVGLSVAGTGTQLVAQDLIIDATAPEVATQEGGRALQATAGASVQIRRAQFLDNRDVGLIAHGPKTRLWAEDLLIRSTLAQAKDGQRGRAIVIADLAEATLVGAVVVGNRDVGVAVQHASLLVAGLVLGDTAAGLGGAWGLGLSVCDGSTLGGWGIALTGNSGAGLLVLGSKVTLGRVALLGTLASAIPGAGLPAGDGLQASDAAQVSLNACLAAHNDRAGLLVDGGKITLQTARIEGNGYGWSLQSNAQLLGAAVTSLANTLNVWLGQPLAILPAPQPVPLRPGVAPLTL